jgi:replicative DNA helicase
MDKSIIKALMGHEFYLEVKHRLSENVFGDDFKPLYKTIVAAHDKFEHDLTATELEVLWKAQNPVATNAEIGDITDLIRLVENSEQISSDVADEAIQQLHRRDLGTRLANLSIELSEGSPTAFNRLRKLVDQSENNLTTLDFGDPVTDDLMQILDDVSDKNRFKFNIETLSRRVYGIGRGEFGVVFAVPNAGKTAFMVSLACGPGGFCDQGAKVLYLGNEEKGTWTKLRAHQAFCGLTKDQIVANPQAAVSQFEVIRQNFIMYQSQEWDMEQYQALIERIQPDVVIIDQADKVNIAGNFNASHERLRELYRRLREISKKYNIALIGVSQASNEARNRTRLSPFDMEGSKIGKAAETDLIIGIGKHEQGDIDDSEPDPTRYLTVGKNKLTGWHGTIVVNIDAAISRYVE